MTTFAERLKHAMGEAHMTQSDLSAKTGFSKAAISQYLSGKNQPKQDKIDRLADVLGASPEFLLGHDVFLDFEPLPTEQISTRAAARYLGKSENFIRIGLQRGILPFGWAVPGTGKRFMYYINPVLFREYISTNVDGAESQFKNDDQRGDTLPVEEAAQLMGKTPQFVRLGLQQRVLPIGAAVKVNATTWDYYISPKLFTEFTGIEVQTGSEKREESPY